jgi:hypothetical protein
MQQKGNSDSGAREIPLFHGPSKISYQFIGATNATAAKGGTSPGHSCSRRAPAAAPLATRRRCKINQPGVSFGSQHTEDTERRVREEEACVPPYLVTSSSRATLPTKIPRSNRSFCPSRVSAAGTASIVEAAVGFRVAAAGRQQGWALIRSAHGGGDAGI